jgi:hypothetical protein
MKSKEKDMDKIKKPRKRRSQSQDLIERRFVDKKWEVRCTLAGRLDWTPTADQFNRGLTDGHYLVREAWVYRKDLVLTQELIEIGLTDDWVDNRIKWTEIYFRQLDMRRGTPTLEQMERGLADVDEYIRSAWDKRMGEDENMRCMWIEREGFSPTTEQIDDGLKDTSDRVCSIWMRIAKRQLCTNFDAEASDDSSTFQSI